MIKSIRIQNFKSIRDVTVALEPVTVLVGRSGAGKTNFVLALKFLRDYLQYGRGAIERHFGAIARIPHVLHSEDKLAFEVCFDVPGFAETFTYRLVLNAPTSHPTLESLRLGDVTLFEQGIAANSSVKWLTPPKVTPTPQAGEITIGRIPGIQETVLAFAALTVGIGVYRFPTTVLTKVGDSNGSIGLSDGAENFVSVLRDMVTNWQQVNMRKEVFAALRKINDSVRSVELDSIQSPQHAVVGHASETGTMALDLSQESDGFRRFYAHLLALYQSPPKQVVVFEEPENGIHPGALSLLAEEIEASPTSGRAQVILTTQSPGLLDHFPTEQIRVVELVELETKIGRLSDEQRDLIRDSLLRPGELLTVDPARRAEVHE